MRTICGPVHTYFIHLADYSDMTLIGRTDGGTRTQYAAPFDELAAALTRATGDTVTATARRHLGAWHCDPDEHAIEIPAADIAHLVATRIRDERIAAIRGLSDAETIADAADAELATWAAAA